MLDRLSATLRFARAVSAMCRLSTAALYRLRIGCARQRCVGRGSAVLAAHRLFATVLHQPLIGCPRLAALCRPCISCSWQRYICCVLALHNGAVLAASAVVPCWLHRAAHCRQRQWRAKKNGVFSANDVRCHNVVCNLYCLLWWKHIQL